MKTTEKGEIALLKVYFRAIEKGVIVSKPVLEGTRYDVILDSGKLERAQVKYANGKTSNCAGSVKVTLEKNSRSRKEHLVYSPEEIDVLLVYLPVIDKVCCFPPPLWAGKRSMYVRYQPALNGQKYDCIMAEEYIW